MVANERTPGVPQISVKRVSLSSSMIRLRPKSAIITADSSAWVLKSRFSGLRSIKGGSDETDWNGRLDRVGRTAVDDACVVKVLDSLEDGANQICCVAR